jgi:hypothetical protein
MAKNNRDFFIINSNLFVNVNFARKITKKNPYMQVKKCLFNILPQNIDFFSGSCEGGV